MLRKKVSVVLVITMLGCSIFGGTPVETNAANYNLSYSIQRLLKKLKEKAESFHSSGNSTSQYVSTEEFTTELVTTEEIFSAAELTTELVTTEEAFFTEELTTEFVTTEETFSTEVFTTEFVTTVGTSSSQEATESEESSEQDITEEESSLVTPVDQEKIYEKIAVRRPLLIGFFFILSPPCSLNRGR